MLASTSKGLAFSDVAMAMRRLFGSRGGAARPDIVAAEDSEEALESDESEEARAAYSKAQNRKWGREKGAGCRKSAAIK